MTKSNRRLLKILAISLASVVLVLILFAVAVRLVLVEYLAVDCSLQIRYGWYEELREFAEAHPEKKFPPLSSTPGALFLDVESVSPRFLTNWGPPFCVVTRSKYEHLPIEKQFADPTLAYFGYALSNEDELLAFLGEYPKFIENGADFNADLPAPDGKGSFGGDKFLRLTLDMRQRGASETSDFPILFEIPDYAENKLESRHWSGMGYSITLNSSLKSLKSGSTFPMTQAIIEKIGEIKMRYAKP